MAAVAVIPTRSSALGSGVGRVDPGGSDRLPASPLPARAVVALTLVAFVATDYKFRRRSLAQSIGGQADLAVLAELGLFALVALGLLFVAGRLPVSPSRTAGPAKWLVAFTAVAGVSALWSPYPALAAVRAGQLAILVYGAVTLAVHATPRLLHAVAHGFVGLAVASAVLGVVFRYDYRLDTILAEPVPRYSWFVVHPVVAGVYLATAIVLAAGYTRRSSLGARWPRWAYQASIAVCGVALVATKTRASMAAAVVGVAVLAALTVRRVRWADVLLVVALVTGLLVTVAADDVGEFLQRGQSSEELTSLSTRTHLWSEALDRFAESPVAGYGLQAARGLFYETTQLGGGHNALINVLVETGAVGTFCWLALLAAIVAQLRRLWRDHVRRSDVALVAAVLATHLVNAVTFEGLGSVLNVALLWLLLLVAWVEVLRRQEPDPA